METGTTPVATLVYEIHLSRYAVIADLDQLFAAQGVILRMGGLYPRVDLN
ncbi:MAG: hypothetical protein O7B35_10265 [Deltaproteobacteria bacterium]|nr:hypothetical protein [Deltaproteobacteria bacterium]